MACISLIELIQRAFPTVSAIATRVARDNLHRELAELGGYLCTFAEEINAFSPEQKRILEDSIELRRVLCEIENIVSDAGIISRQIDQYPTLQTIAEGNTLLEEETRGASQLTEKLEKGIRRRLRKLLRTGLDFRPAVDMIQTCSSIPKNVSPDFAEPSPVKEEPPEYPQQLQALYNVLRKHAICTCNPIPASNGHWVKLRLTPSPSIVDESQFQFEMLFSSYPDPSYRGFYDWQSIQMVVSSSKSFPKNVRFSEATMALHTRQAKYNPSSNAVKPGDFCRLISSRCGSFLRFAIFAGHLRILLDDPCAKQQIKPTAGISLGKALEIFDMRHGVRPILAYILAKSVWDYYTSDWMNTLWTSNTIFFMEEESGGQVVSHFCKPYQQIEFTNDNGKAIEYLPVIGMMHKYPRVLALGIMLIELATGTSILAEGTQLQQLSARTANDQLVYLRSVLDTGAFAEDCRFPRYKTAISKCLDPKLFKAAPFNPENPPENLEQRRRIIYEEIVDPLKQLIKGTGWDSELDELERIPLAPKNGDLLTPLSNGIVQNGYSEPSLKGNDNLQRELPYRLSINHKIRKFDVSGSIDHHLRLENYHIGWICAIQTEYVAAVELLDKEFPPPSNMPIWDENAYTFGLCGNHHVVIACLPKGKYGLVSAASVVNHMLRTFHDIRIGLMVGIGGGAPSEKNDIRLGDVVVSTPGPRGGGVIHYEFGKTIQNKSFQSTGSLNSSPAVLLSALQNLSSLHERRGHQITSTVEQMISKNKRLQGYRRPNPQTDVLYKSSFTHRNASESCMDQCIQHRNQIIRQGDPDYERESPVIHYGLIASADRLMKDAHIRDHLSETEDVLCFEMEAAGLMDRFPCVVIRGICDYSDTHKNDLWQGYAAATAAAYAKELLKVIPSY